MTLAKTRGKGDHVAHDYYAFPNGTGPLVFRRSCRPDGALYLAGNLHFQPEGRQDGWRRVCPDCRKVKHAAHQQHPSTQAA